MKYLLTNPESLKEITSGNRTYTDKTSFCGLPPITLRQLIGGLVASLINEIISGTKNSLLNFVGRLKSKWRTLTKKITVPHRQIPRT